jgi:hypothetical protein
VRHGDTVVALAATQPRVSADLSRRDRRTRSIEHLAIGARLARQPAMTRSYRLPRRIARKPRSLDAAVTSLGFTCFRLEPDFSPIESMFPRISMALLVRPAAAPWLR